MTNSFSLLSALALAAPLAAQIQYNEVIRFGAIDLVQATTHPTTNLALEVPGAQPAAYMATSTAGVAAGTLTWIWYPSQLDARFGDRQVTGHMVAVRPSSATPLSDYGKTHQGQPGPGVPIYIPKFAILQAKARTGAPGVFGKGFDPDFSKAPLLTYNTVHTPLVQPAQADRALVWTIVYNTAVAVQTDEPILAFEWQGGEHYSKPRSQSLPTGWSESDFSPPHWGWAEPAPGRAITHFDQTKILPGTSASIYSSPMGGYFTNHASVQMHTDWGEKREPLLKGLLYPSHNVGSGIADVATTPGEIGWNVYTGTANAGLRAMPLLNVRLAPQPTATAFLGNLFEVDLGDPVLGLVWGNPTADGIISTWGVWFPTKRLAVPALGPTAIGLWVGMEFGLVEIASGAVRDSTQATWFYIVR